MRPACLSITRNTMKYYEMQLDIMKYSWNTIDYDDIPDLVKIPWGIACAQRAPSMRPPILFLWR